MPTSFDHGSSDPLAVYILSNTSIHSRIDGDVTLISQSKRSGLHDVRILGHEILVLGCCKIGDVISNVTNPIRQP